MAESAAVKNDSPPVVVFKKRRVKENARKRPATPELAASHSDDDSDSSSGDGPRPGRIVKRRQLNPGVVAATSTGENHSKTTRDIASNAPLITAQRQPLPTANDATKASNWYDEGTKAKIGPTKTAPTNVRLTTYTDFAPDVCKDYKKTGYCGFGQNCVFLHDRGDYKQGWELDRDWENVTKGKKLAGTVVASRNKTDDLDDSDDDEAILKNIPFACIICEESYKYPVVTRCGHYFCEPCALKRYRKDPTCAACGSGTNGVFNSASKLKQLLQKKQERLEKRRQAAIAAGEDVSDDDND